MDQMIKLDVGKGEGGGGGGGGGGLIFHQRCSASDDKAGFGGRVREGGRG